MAGRHHRLALVADDDRDIAKVVAVNLRAEGFKVKVVGNGWEAQAEAIRTAPDLIVLDVVMPGRSGLEVLQALRSRPETRRIPVVLLTAGASDADIWAGWRAGAAYYITKPFDPDELLHFVRDLLDGRSKGM